MKQVFCIFASVLLVSACSNNKGTTGHNEHIQQTQQEAQQHLHSCPMHPEVTGKNGDNCPKCGMKLTPSTVVAKSNDYFMKVTFNPTAIEPGKEVMLSFRPSIRGNEKEAVALDVEHEKKIHLILVNEDLSWFDHIHPEYAADGTYKVAERFPAAGKYFAFADYKPRGASHVVDKVKIGVNGSAPALNFPSTEKLEGVSGNFSFELKPVTNFHTGDVSHIEGIVKKNGKEINANSLGEYLGAKAHFVMISLNEKEYLHVHPMVRENGRFGLHAAFKKPGIHRGWVQFMADGELNTIDFTVDVK